MRADVVDLRSHESFLGSARSVGGGGAACCREQNR